MSMIPRHLLGSLKSPFFGTGTHWLVLHSLWSIFPSKKSETCLCIIRRDVSSIALRASGGMPLRPGAFPFFSLLMARLTSRKVIGVSMALRHGFCGMSSRTVSSTGLWLLRTLWKCRLKTDIFSFALEARSPDLSFIAMLMLVLWWVVSPPVRRRMFSHARRGLNRMLCILVHIPLYQRALARSTRSRLRLLMYFNFSWMSASSVSLRACLSCSWCRNWFFSSMAGASMDSLAWYHPSH